MTILLATFGNICGVDALVVLVMVLVLFGAKKLPELARGLGQSLNEFKKAREDFEHELHQTTSAVTPREAQNRQPYNTPPSTQTTEQDLRRQLQEAQDALRAVQQQKSAPQLLEPGTPVVLEKEGTATSTHLPS